MPEDTLSIDILRYDAQTITRPYADSISELREIAASGDLVTWAHVTDLQKSNHVTETANAFGFHELVVDDILSNRQRPKVETYGDQLFIVAQVPTVAGGFATEQVAILLCHNVVLTFQAGKTDCFAPVRKRLDEKLGCIRERKQDYLIYALLDAIIDAYFPIVEQIRDKLTKVEQELAESASVDSITTLQTLRSTLFLIRATIEPHQELVSQLLRDTHHFEDETKVYLRDVSDHLSQVLHATETNRELAADLRDYCFAEISFNQNETMKLLTIVASIFIPLSFIVGLYGMNFDPDISSWNMPETKWKYGYLIALGLMVLVVIGALGSLAYLGKRQRGSRRQRFSRAMNIFDRESPGD